MPKPLPLYPGARPCICCGYCCKRAPCPYGKPVSPSVSRCAHLTSDDMCAIYEEILKRPQEEWWGAPAFGAGCCSPLNMERLKKVCRPGAGGRHGKG